METLSARETLDLLHADPRGFLDVRAPIEFAKGGVPGFANLPILDDAERAAVGTAYVQAGHQAAVELGQRLVGPAREQRTRAWADVVRASARGFGVVTCWRGGLRSRFAQSWLAEAGVPVRRVAGGYRALRRDLLAVLAEPPPLLVLTGFTGCGKTELLVSVRVPKIDLEGLGRHRGSAFGRRWDGPQPQQQWFENALAHELRVFAGHRDEGDGAVLVEDESATLGQLYLPVSIKERMRRSPLVVLETALSERVSRVRGEYVDEPLARGVSPEALFRALDDALIKIERRLGGALCAELRGQLSDAVTSREPEAHHGWIARLLRDYYDKAYAHALARSPRPVAFRGDRRACREWLEARPAPFLDLAVAEGVS